MEIVDNGVGFDIDSMNSNIGHGLANILTRAHSLGGEADISSVMNEGTTILIWIPRYTADKTNT
jgi:signal transduction histidine kinase